MTLNKLRLQANEKGFTLIELMIVIAIIGILAAIAIPNFISYRNKAFCSAAESDAQAIGSALADYFAIPGNQGYSHASSATNTLSFPGSASLKLSGTNTAVVTQTTVSGAPTFGIAVTDNSRRCPTNYQQGNSKWSNNTPGVYSYTL